MSNNIMQMIHIFMDISTIYVFKSTPRLFMHSDTLVYVPF